MKCTFISPHRSDVGRANPAPDVKDRIRSDSGGTHNNRGWLASLCLVTAILFLGFNSLTAGHCEGIGSFSKWMDPIHHEIDFTKVASINKAPGNEVIKWPGIVDAQIPIVLKIERFSFDLSKAPEVKSSRMSNWSMNGGHPNTADIKFRPETTNTEYQLRQLMNYRDNKFSNRSMLLFSNEPGYENSSVINKSLANKIDKPASNVQTQYLTPQNPLLWLV